MNAINIHFRCYVKGIMISILILISARMYPAEYPITGCDSVTARWETENSGSVALASTHIEGTGALHIEIPGFPSGGSIPVVTYNVESDQRNWNGYEGIRFKVKGNGSSNWGNIVLIDDPELWNRHYAQFPIENGVWTEVTIAWRDFLQQKWRGPIDENLDAVHRIRFSIAASRFPAYPYADVPGHSYDIDDIRIVNGLSLESTPWPTDQTTSIDDTVAKLKAKESVRIVVMGASIAHGSGSPNKETTAMPQQLEGLLRGYYDYTNITVLNKSISGFTSYQGAAMLGQFCYDFEPVDLVIFTDYCYNDYIDDDNNGTGQAEVMPNGTQEDRLNHERLFANVLRHGNMEVMYLLNGMHVGLKPFEYGEIDRADPINNELKDLCNGRNIYTADIYGIFQALGFSYLEANYFTIDSVHYNENAQTHAAEIVRDAIIAAGNMSPSDPAITLTIPTSAAEGDGVLPDAGTVSVSEAPETNLIITLGSSDTSECIVPGTVTIISGETFAAFDLTVIDDSDPDWNVNVTVTASADGYRNGTDAILILDNDGGSPPDNTSGTKSGCAVSESNSPLLSCLLLFLFTRSIVIWLRSPSTFSGP